MILWPGILVDRDNYGDTMEVSVVSGIPARERKQDCSVRAKFWGKFSRSREVGELKPGFEPRKIDKARREGIRGF